MSLDSDTILLRFRQALASDRLAHAYLLLGADSAQLEALAMRIAELLLGPRPEIHPDFHLARAESRLRRLSIERMRRLMELLALKPYRGRFRLALICDAERMCLGGGEAANSFLKTLEEPPHDVVILLTSTQPQMLLPTITSRCIRLPVRAAPEMRAEEDPREAHFFSEWFASGEAPLLRAFRRAALLETFFLEIRKEIESGRSDGDDEEPEEVRAALVEAAVDLRRERLLAKLEAEYAKKAGVRETGSEEAESPGRKIRILEELLRDLRSGLDPSLSYARACLEIEESLKMRASGSDAKDTSWKPKKLPN
ncbi:DNA polymerase III subunit tau [Methylacidimicrobium cyclopophantes]|uniref:DNA polymerase III subunit tau n=1 Tax=Methylacidimicrobium cyclopophantes TaxID=1041766 RepID=A0A5E6MK69_9BACT|nr:hypothetical protein [Methylacidimicrobium cyclopophantes]VVM06447.1 DNA polymerase III subunit tau [Methylacidimicrobium cyclopophantes]